MARSRGQDDTDWRLGDIVFVAEDGHSWGREESLAQWVADGNRAADFPGNFVIIKIPDVSVAKLARLRARAADSAGRDTLRRIWSVTLASLPAGIKTKLQTTGTITIGPGGDVTAAQAANFVASKIDGAHPDLTP